MFDTTIKCKIIGTGNRRLLMDPMSDETLDDLRKGIPKPKRTDISLEDEAKSKLYLDGDGNIVIPTENIFACLRFGGRFVKNGKKQISTQKGETILSSFLTIDEEYFKLTDGNGGKPVWHVDKRRGVSNNRGSSNALCVVRPRFDSWGLEFIVKINSERVKSETIKKLVEESGLVAGLCSFRPSKGGRFGMFEIVEWEVLDGKVN